MQTSAKIINWRDDARFSAYYRCCYRGPDGPRADPHPFHPAQGMENRTTRFRPRKELQGQRQDLATLQRLIRQLVIHHDGANSSSECFHILHDERGLSVHFLIDSDGTIYQTLDLADVAFHAQSVNGFSIGVELCNRGLVALSSSAAHRQRREPRLARIHGQEYRMWSFTDAQYQSLAQLTEVLHRIFPGLLLSSPQNAGPIYTKLAQPERYSGLLGHYHVSAQKWDPGCFDFPRLLGMLPGRRLIGVGPTVQGTGNAAVPQLLQAEVKSPHGGYFPVASCGRELVWHGGSHLKLPLDSPIPAQLGGQIVAARLQRRNGRFGSTNFVLTRHDIRVGTKQVRFFVLYYHLAPLLEGEVAPAWRRREGAERAAQLPLSGLDVFFPDVDILSGEILGRSGVAGPPGSQAPQLHLEVFSADEVATDLFPALFESRECGDKGPLCSDDAVQSIFASRTPQRFLDDAQLDAQTARRAAALRRLALRFPSEWTVKGAADFDQGLRCTAVYRKASPTQRAAVYHEQVLPAAWLDRRVARHLGLPAEGVLWHYHPIEFLAAMTERQGQLEGQPATSAPTSVQTDAQPSSEAALDGAKSDGGYASEEDLAEWELGAGIELSTEELSTGYPAHWLR